MSLILRHGNGADSNYVCPFGIAKRLCHQSSQAHTVSVSINSILLDDFSFGDFKGQAHKLTHLFRYVFFVLFICSSAILFKFKHKVTAFLRTFVISG